jgi:hypothetical protein
MEEIIKSYCTNEILSMYVDKAELAKLETVPRGLLRFLFSLVRSVPFVLLFDEALTIPLQ